MNLLEHAVFTSIFQVLLLLPWQRGRGDCPATQWLHAAGNHVTTTTTTSHCQPL